jgi:hypothetical protein
VWVFLHPLLRTLDRPVDLEIGKVGDGAVLLYLPAVGHIKNPD